MNVRSIIGKLPDIESDTNLTNASILCFCETWLVPTQELPLIREGHTVLRCDKRLMHDSNAHTQHDELLIMWVSFVRAG